MPKTHKGWNRQTMVSPPPVAGRLRQPFREPPQRRQTTSVLLDFPLDVHFALWRASFRYQEAHGQVPGLGDFRVVERRQEMVQGRPEKWTAALKGPAKAEVILKQGQLRQIILDTSDKDPRVWMSGRLVDLAEGEDALSHADNNAKLVGFRYGRLNGRYFALIVQTYPIEDNHA